MICFMQKRIGVMRNGQMSEVTSKRSKLSRNGYGKSECGESECECDSQKIYINQESRSHQKAGTD